MLKASRIAQQFKQILILKPDHVLTMNHASMRCAITCSKTYQFHIKDCLLAPAPSPSFKERFEITFAEASRSLALDYFKEDSGTIDDRLGEDLQQVALVVVIQQDPQRGQLLYILFDLANTIKHGFVIRRGSGEEIDAAFLQITHR